MRFFTRNKRVVTQRELEYQWKADVLKAVISRINNPHIMDGKVIMPSGVSFSDQGQLQMAMAGGAGSQQRLQCPGGEPNGGVRGTSPGGDGGAESVPGTDPSGTGTRWAPEDAVAGGDQGSNTGAPAPGTGPPWQADSHGPGGGPTSVTDIFVGGGAIPSPSPGTAGIRGPASDIPEDLAPEATGTYAGWFDRLSVKALGEPPDNLLKGFRGGNLYFEDAEVIIRMIASALADGKHIIFYGPPGTGKTSIARMVCDMYSTKYALVTGTSDWSTFDTIGGYILERSGQLVFNPGLILRSYKTAGEPANNWLIIDEINRADIDKAFGPMFSALTGDDVTLAHKIGGKSIHILGRPKEDDVLEPNKFFVHPDWRILATLNTFDKASLYEMSYAFMRRFSFIPIMIPEDLDTALQGLISVWGMEVDDTLRNNVLLLWKHINKYRRIGPAIVRDILLNIIRTGNYNGAIIMNVLHQFEGMEEHRIKEFLYSLTNLLMKEIDVTLLKTAMEDFINVDLTSV